MEVRPLEIRIIKAHDLKDVNLMSKMDVYAVVSISGDQLNNRKQKTTVDKDGGTSPKWNFAMEFTVDTAAVDDNRLTLKIKLVSSRSLGDKEIGVVYVQIKELFDNFVHGGGDGNRDGAGDGDGKGGDEEEEKSGSYSVRLSNGKAKGALDLAYKFGKKYKVEPPPEPPLAAPYGMKGVEAPPVMAYPSAFPGSSSMYPPPPPGAYPYPPPPGAYPPPPHPDAYPPPPPGYGYPPPPPGYGYGGYPPPPPGYGYPPMQQPHEPKRSGGGGMGLGLGAGLLGGLLIGDMMSDF